MARLLILVFLITTAVCDPANADSKRKFNRSKIPSFDVTRICRGLKRKDFDACYRKEWAAQDLLVKRWAATAAEARSHCVEQAEQAAVPTYGALLKCLDEADEAKSPDANLRVQKRSRASFIRPPPSAELSRRLLTKAHELSPMNRRYVQQALAAVNFPAYKSSAVEPVLRARVSKFASKDARQCAPRADRMPRWFNMFDIASMVIAPPAWIASTTGSRCAMN